MEDFGEVATRHPIHPAVSFCGTPAKVSFTYLFGLKSNVAHALMVAALTLLICGILFTIGEFNDPFSGPVGIRPEAFREVLHSFGGT
jgi:hypothetical protein